MNKKAYLIFLVLFTYSLASVAQIEQNLLPIKLNGKSGLINRQGDIVIEPRYDAIETRFEEGYALVRIEDRTGVVDISGAEIIPVQYDHIKFLGDDYFGVYNQGLAGVIDKNNTQIIPI
ncbi:MAG: WG repeat-containing protein, partial [Cytophagia bacterium]|nr:WG repeat-containing protein [Cytophagia bacterium]